ncbi:MAG: Nramp family divalent metal transporter [bacterium]|nr:MAG: Nramp family divalent metal transporter [bacterium]
MNDKSNDNGIKIPPRGMAILALVGPSFVWCAEYIGTGEVILATRTGAILGYSIIWAVVFGIFLKYWIGMCGARYTVCTGEGMIDMFDRIPGPRHWVVWIVLIAQFISATISIGSVASAAGIFMNGLIPISPYFGGWFVTIFSLIVVWSGIFDLLKIVMSFFVLIIIIGVLYVAITVFPDLAILAQGFLIDVPAIPEWAYVKAGASQNPWKEILPLLGWGAGGFASQVWYTYWVLGAGYGAARDREYGKPADLAMLRNVTRATAEKIKGWCRVVYTDATIAMIIGNVVTVGFLMAGAGVLRPLQLAPQGAQVATTLAHIFSSKWGAFGGFIFMISATVALVGTQIGQLAGWPRLLADSFRICIPGFQKKFSWKTQFKGFLLFFLFTNIVIVFSFGLKPIIIVQLSAILDGLLLTPLQAIWIAIGLYVVMPKLFKDEARQILKPHWIFAAGLVIAFIVFGYFCIFQIPYIF